MSTTADKELEILETIHTAKENETPVVQRDIAHIVGVSLGMTNAILKRLVKKGFLTIKKVNNRNIHYAVSPEGMKALSERSYGYFKRTIKNVVYYKEKIGEVIESAAERGHRTIVLAGESDLDFIVEHFCYKHGLHFKRVKDGTIPRDDAFVVYSEKQRPPADFSSPYHGRNTSRLNGEDIEDEAGASGVVFFYLRNIMQ